MLEPEMASRGAAFVAQLGEDLDLPLGDAGQLHSYVDQARWGSHGCCSHLAGIGVAAGAGKREERRRLPTRGRRTRGRRTRGATATTPAGGTAGPTRTTWRIGCGRSRAGPTAPRCPRDAGPEVELAGAAGHDCARTKRDGSPALTLYLKSRIVAAQRYPAVRRKGLEPLQELPHWNLNPARLPIPPPSLGAMCGLHTRPDCILQALS